MNKGLKLKREGGVEPRTVRFLKYPVMLDYQRNRHKHKINAQLPHSTVTCGPGAPALLQSHRQRFSAWTSLLHLCGGEEGKNVAF